MFIRRSFRPATLMHAALMSLLAGVVTGPAEAQGAGHSFRQQAVACARPAVLDTGPRETAEAILPDGTSLILAPGSRARIACAEGGARVELEQGLIRVAGRAVTVSTPQAQLALTGGAAVVEVAGASTRAHLLNGEGLRVSADGADRLIYRPGFQVMAAGGSLGQPRRIDRTALIEDILRLSEGLRTGQRPRIGASGGATIPGPGPRVAQAGAGAVTGIFVPVRAPAGSAAGGGPATPTPDDGDGEGSGDGDGTPGGGTGTPPGGGTGTPPGGGTGTPPGGGTGGGTGPVGPTLPVVPAFNLAAGTGGLGALSPSTAAVQLGQVTNEQSTSTADEGSAFTSLRQGFADVLWSVESEFGGSSINKPGFDVPRRLGPGTDRLMGAAALAQTILGPEDVASFGDAARRVKYYFGTPSFGLTLGNSDFYDNSGFLRLSGGLGSSRTLVEGGGQLEPGPYFEGLYLRLPDSGFGTIPYEGFKMVYDLVPEGPFDPRAPLGQWRQGTGAVASSIVTALTDTTFDDAFEILDQTRRPDNFVFHDVRPVIALGWRLPVEVRDGWIADLLGHLRADFLSEGDSAFRAHVEANREQLAFDDDCTGTCFTDDLFAAGGFSEAFRLAALDFLIRGQTEIRDPADFDGQVARKLAELRASLGEGVQVLGSSRIYDPDDSGIDGGEAAGNGGFVREFYAFDGVSQFEDGGDGQTRISTDGSVLVEDPTETRRYIFAAGDLDGVIENPNPGRVVDRFHLSAGIEGRLRSVGYRGLTAADTGMDTSTGNRAFLRAESWTDLAGGAPGFALSTADLVQSPFSIIYTGRNVIPDAPGAAGAPPTAKVLHADLGLAMADGRQVSTISATIGEARFRFAQDLSGAGMVDALLDLHTVGASRGLAADGTSASAILFSSGLQSTAAGGGNQNLGTTPGRLGFLVLENAGRVFDDVEDRGILPGGEEHAVGAAEAQRFALLRLGVATGSAPVAETRAGLAGHMGFAAALVDVETGDGVALAPLGAPGSVAGQQLAPNLRFGAFDAEANVFTADLGYVLGTAAGRTIALGGGGRSAYVDDRAFGVRSADGSSDMALIAGDMVAAGVPGLGARTAGYEHVRWGFFFGDTRTRTADAGREHVALGSWAGGQPYTVEQMERFVRDGAKDVAVTYQGHMLGNVVNAGQIRTVAGSYSDTFDFAARTGSVSIAFDDRNLTGTSGTNWTGLGATDPVPYVGAVTGGGLSGGLNGMFIGGGGGGAVAPAGIVGAFSLTDGATGGYRATGTFAGESR